MKGIILAGGTGSRLYPLTAVCNKHLQAVYDKPMIYYPLTTLIASRIRELCLITSPGEVDRFKVLLGTGEQWGISIEYRIQQQPRGIAEAFLIAESFIGKDNVCLILGDNILSGSDAIPQSVLEFAGGALIFGYQVQDPERYGVVQVDAQGRPVGIEEKPVSPKSNLAIPGVYLYDSDVVAIARGLSPSARGELEISDLNKEYLRQGRLTLAYLARGFAWLDAGTSASLHEASAYISAIERRQGLKIGCPEEAAFRRGYLSVASMAALVDRMPKSEYRDYLTQVVLEAQKRGAA